MAYGDFKDLPRKTISNKVLCDKAFNIAKNPTYDGYQKVLLQWFKNFLIKSLLVLIHQVVLLKVKLCQTRN